MARQNQAFSAVNRVVTRSQTNVPIVRAQPNVTQNNELISSNTICKFIIGAGFACYLFGMDAGFFLTGLAIIFYLVYRVLSFVKSSFTS